MFAVWWASHWLRHPVEGETMTPPLRALWEN